MKNKLNAAAKVFFKINLLLNDRFGKPKKNKKSDPLDVLIATILSQNTNDYNSYQAYLNLKTNFPTYDLLLNARQSEIERVVKVAGLGKQKAFAIKNFLKSLHKERGELNLNFIKDYTEKEAIDYLIKFKGIGVKTAACVLLFGLQKNICPVDTHVFRVINRIGIVKETSRDKLFYKLMELISQDLAYELHTNLIRLGREICTSQKPLCFSCPIIKICKYENKSKRDTKTKHINLKRRDFILLERV